MQQPKSAPFKKGAPIDTQNEHPSSLATMAVRSLKSCRRKYRVADSTGVELSARELLIRSLLLRKKLRSDYLTEQDIQVGVLLPPSAAAVATNLALTIDKRIPVNLNYSLGANLLLECIQTAEIKCLISSRKFLGKLGISIDCEKLVLLEDLPSRITLFDKLQSAWLVYSRSAEGLIRRFKLNQTDLDASAAILFTSGSTDLPKGVVLTHGNIAHNLSEIQRIGKINPKDVLLGVLPFFHSFGFTAALWATLTQDVGGVFHYHPLEAEKIGALAAKYRATIFLSTPSFLRKYLRRISKDDFDTLDFVLSGGEPLHMTLADDVESKFGVRPVEAYGATECSPLISVNAPPSRSTFQSEGSDRLGGSVGKPAFAVDVKIVGLDNGRRQDTGVHGLILVRGPNVMAGYFGRDDLTQVAIVDGWYNTGDIGFVDSNGFLHITGRLSRFSKIGGEMVPHVRIENLLAEFLRCGNEDDLIRVSVGARTNEASEEQLVVLFVSDSSVDSMNEFLQESGLPNLMIPKPSNYIRVKEIPCLPTGKVDLRQVKEIICHANWQSQESRQNGFPEI